MHEVESFRRRVKMFIKAGGKLRNAPTTITAPTVSEDTIQFKMRFKFLPRPYFSSLSTIIIQSFDVKIYWRWGYQTGLILLITQR